MKIINLKYLTLIPFLLISLYILGCGNHSSENTQSDIIVQSNTTTSDIISIPNDLLTDRNYTLLDAPVTGISYICGKKKSFTDTHGTLTCPQDTNISFAIGGIYLGSVDSSKLTDNIITPHDIFSLSYNNLEDNRLLHFLRFVQSLDEDHNCTNGIVINTHTQVLLANSYLDITDTNTSETDLTEIIESVDNAVLLTKTQALTHYKTTLKKLGLYARPKQEPYYKYAWHLQAKNSILNSLKNLDIDPHADINISKAWDLSRGEGIKVAIIDTNFDTAHEDLKSNIMITYNVNDESDDVTNTTNFPSHGNSCAGFIVSPINGKGTIGTAPEASLIAIKLAMQNNSQLESDIIKAFEYAKAQDAQVVSCSWGTENISEAVDYEFKRLYQAGITILFATGNAGKSLDQFGLKDESESEWVLGIGASGENNDVTSYSNYGEHIDLIAPGGDRRRSIGLLAIDDTGKKGQKNQEDLVTENYTFTYGTSFSTPITAGVVALMYGVNPAITPAQVKDILIQSADKVGGDLASYNETGFDERRAYGKLNAGKAVMQAKLLLE